MKKLFSLLLIAGCMMSCQEEETLLNEPEIEMEVEETEAEVEHIELAVERTERAQ